MPSIDLPTAFVHYTEHGQGAPLVLLHANPGDSEDFEAVVPAFANTYRVLALDWPGYGRSAPPQQPESVGVLFFNQVLREFLAALALPPAFFIGNSLGATQRHVWPQSHLNGSAVWCWFPREASPPRARFHVSSARCRPAGFPFRPVGLPAGISSVALTTSHHGRADAMRVMTRCFIPRPRSPQAPGCEGR